MHEWALEIWNPLETEIINSDQYQKMHLKQVTNLVSLFKSFCSNLQEVIYKCRDSKNLMFLQTLLQNFTSLEIEEKDTRFLSEQVEFLEKESLRRIEDLKDERTQENVKDQIYRPIQMDLKMEKEFSVEGSERDKQIIDRIREEERLRGFQKRDLLMQEKTEDEKEISEIEVNNFKNVRLSGSGVIEYLEQNVRSGGSPGKVKMSLDSIDQLGDFSMRNLEFNIKGIQRKSSFGEVNDRQRRDQPSKGNQPVDYKETSPNQSNMKEELTNEARNVNPKNLQKMKMKTKNVELNIHQEFLVTETDSGRESSIEVETTEQENETDQEDFIANQQKKPKKMSKKILKKENISENSKEYANYEKVYDDHSEGEQLMPIKFNKRRSTFKKKKKKKKKDLSMPIKERRKKLRKSVSEVEEGDPTNLQIWVLVNYKWENNLQL